MQPKFGKKLKSDITAVLQMVAVFLFVYFSIRLLAWLFYLLTT